MKKLACFVFLLLSAFIPLQSQQTKEEKGKNYAVHIDAGFGYLVAANLNIEKAFSTYSSGSFKTVGRVGLAYIYIPDLFCDGSSGTFASAGLTYFIGPGNHHLELSGGGLIKLSETENNPGGIFNCDSDLNFLIPLVEVGYRYQKPTGGFLFRFHIGTSGVAIGLGTAW